MWIINKAFLRSYISLSLTSFICLGHPWIQRILVLIWIVSVVRISDNARHNGMELSNFLCLACVSQFTGIVLTFISVWSIVSGKFGEWPSGLMEVWYHPFIPVLEMIPPGHLGNWSYMHLATCLVPVGMISVCWVCWMTGWFPSNVRRNP